jgi:ankyrin repeat protein
MLLENGTYVDTRDNLGNTPLRYAVQSGNDDTVNVLLKYGADINIAGLDESKEPTENLTNHKISGRGR